MPVPSGSRRPRPRRPARGGPSRTSTPTTSRMELRLSSTCPTTCRRRCRSTATTARPIEVSRRGCRSVGPGCAHGSVAAERSPSSVPAAEGDVAVGHAVGVAAREVAADVLDVAASSARLGQDRHVLRVVGPDGSVHTQAAQEGAMVRSSQFPSERGCRAKGRRGIRGSSVAGHGSQFGDELGAIAEQPWHLGTKPVETGVRAHVT